AVRSPQFFPMFVGLPPHAEFPVEGVPPVRQPRSTTAAGPATFAPSALAANDEPSKKFVGGFTCAQSRNVGARAMLLVNRLSFPGSTPGPRTSNGTRIDSS